MCLANMKPLHLSLYKNAGAVATVPVFYIKSEKTIYVRAGEPLQLRRSRSCPRLAAQSEGSKSQILIKGSPDTHKQNPCPKSEAVASVFQVRGYPYYLSYSITVIRSSGFFRTLFLTSVSLEYPIAITQ